MRYILSSDYRFKGWHEAPTGLYNSRTRMTAFLPKDKYLLLLKCDGGFANNFPNLFKTPLKEILRDSIYTKLSAATVGDVRDHNPKCRKCRFVDRCTGGCRNSVLISCNDYYGIDPEVCEFFDKGYDERIRKAAEEPLEECP